MTVHENHQKLLHAIHEDMPVYAADGDKIGEVEQVHFGATAGTNAPVAAEPSQTVSDRDPDGPIEWIAEAFHTDRVPEEMRQRLLVNGFVRLDADRLFASDRYILPDQIASVNEDGVYLTGSFDDLMKRK